MVNKRFKNILTITILTLVFLIGLSGVKSVYAATLSWSNFTSKFSDISFRDSNGNSYNQTHVGVSNLGLVMTRWGTITNTKWYFEPSHYTYCIQPGTEWLSSQIQIENLYAIYEEKLYAYDKVTDNSFLTSGTLPSDAEIGIGSEYNYLIDGKYKKLAYALSKLHDSSYINLNNPRYEHRLSPVQLAIWQLERGTSLSDNDIVAKMAKGRKDYYDNVSGHATVSVDDLKDIFIKSKKIMAYAAAYDEYASRINASFNTTITAGNYTITQKNGKKIIGPFVIEGFQGVVKKSVSYSYDYSGNGVTLSDSGTVTGRYGNISELTITMKGTTSSIVCDKDGNAISLNSITDAGNIQIYFDITSVSNPTVQDEASIYIKLNNAHRYAYLYTLTHTQTYSDYQTFLVGDGKYGPTHYDTYVFQQAPETINLGGTVWLDVEHGIKPIVAPNGSMDSDESGISGIKVYLFRKNGNTVTKVTETTTNASGRYSFTNIIKNSGDMFKIIFEYDGMNYEAVSNILYSYASEATANRTAFNSKFQNVYSGLTVSDYFAINESTGEIVTSTLSTPDTLQYVYDGNKAILQTKDGTTIKPIYMMYASVRQYYTSSNTNLDFGLTERRPADLAITNEMSNAVNGSLGYTVTYRVNVNNQGATNMAADELAYYLDSKYTFDSATVRYMGTTRTISPSSTVKTVTIDGKEYKKYVFSTGLSDLILNPGERLRIDINCTTSNTNNTTTQYYTFAELTKYVTTEGRIDKDSAPGDAISNGNIVHNSDDSDAATIQTIQQLIEDKLIGDLTY